MDNYTKTEIESLEKWERNIRDLSGDDLNTAFYITLGHTLIKVQKVEYGMLGSILLIKDTIVQTDKNFKNLNPQRFFSTDPNDKEYRKQTLGMIISFFKNKIKIFDTDKLDLYLNQRNDFIHNFWRNHLSHGRSSQRSEIINGYKFALTVYRSSLEWESIFKGFIYEVGTRLLERNNLDSLKSESFKSFQNYHQSFLDSIKYK